MMIPQILTPRLHMGSNVNIVFDGNSIFAGYGASTNSKIVANQVAAMAPVTGTGATVSNFAISGQTWRNMDGLDGGSAADVDGAWQAGKKNVLICWETINSIHNTGRTGVQAAADCASYIGNRQAAHPWIVMLITSLARQNDDWNSTQVGTDALNAQIDIWNNLARNNYKSWGAQVLLDIRTPNGPLNITSYTPAGFDIISSLWYDSPRIHLNDQGMTVLAGMIANRLRQMPIR